MHALGPDGTNGHEAALKAAEMIAAKLKLKRPPGVDLLKSHIDVLEQTHGRNCWGLAAIENDGQGLVGDVVRYLAEGKPSSQVIGELTLPIRHDVFMHPEANENHMIFAISHPQALDQTRKNRARLGLEEGSTTTSTAEAARLIGTKSIPNWDRTVAIASPFAGKTYGLRPIRTHVEDQQGNMTRFYMLGPKQKYDGNGGRTALIFAVPNKPCSLGHTILSIGSGDNVQISSLDRVRLGSKANSVFFLEFEDHVQSEAGKNILRRLHTYVAKDDHGRPRIRILGSWAV